MATTLLINILANAADARKAIGEVTNQIEGLGDESKVMGKALAAGAATALTGLVALGIGAFNAAQESAKVGRETERVLRTTGAAAWESVDGIQALSQAISEKTGVDDEAIQSGANLLLTFTQVQNAVGEGNAIFDRATQAALDMSTALGTEMSGSAIQLGKALNDPIKGLAALSRAGVSFTQTQKDQVEQLVKTGDVLGAQKVILEEVEREFKGAAEAASTPFDKLSVAIGNLQEDIGAKLIPPVTDLANLLLTNLTPAVEATSRFLTESSSTLELLASVGIAAVILAYGNLVVAQLAVAGTGILTFLTDLSVAFETLAGATTLSTAAIEIFGASAIPAAAAALVSFALPVAAIGGAIFALVSVFDTSSEAADRFIESVTKDIPVGNFRSMEAASLRMAQRMTELSASIKAQQGDWRNTAASVADVLIPWHDVENSLVDQQDELTTLSQKHEAYRAALDKANASLLDYAEAHVAAEEGMAGVDKTTLRLSASYADMIPKITGIQSAMQAIAAEKGIDPASAGAVDRLTALYERTKIVGASTLEMSDAQEKFNDITSDAKDKVDAYKSSLDALIGVHMSAAAAETAASDSRLSLIETLSKGKDATVSLMHATEESGLVALNNTKLRNDNNKAIQDTVKSGLDLANATFRETQATEGNAAALDAANAVLVDQRAQLVGVMTQMGFTEAAANDYINRLGFTPENINTQVHLDNRQATGAIGDVLNGYGQIAKGITGTASVIVKVLGGSITAIENKGRADGGPVNRGGMFVVGERGPELFVPNRNGTIIPNKALMGQGTGTVINLSINHTGLGVDSPRLQRDVVETLRRYERRNGTSSALPGTAGAVGPAGPPGADSTVPGPVGPEGPQGDPGPTGSKGDKGDAGAAGTPGTAGAQGPKGDPGIQGTTGATGATGAQGAKGDTGAQGTQGIPGTTGSPGPKGDKGDTGTTGATGSTGPAGPGLPAGGSTGQQPVKTSGTDYAVQWSTERFKWG